MDYDKTAIAASYDAARAYRPEVMQRWLDLVAAHAPPHPRLIIDIGCGTGRFTHPLAQRFKTRVIGIDPSQRMLEGARAKLADGRVSFLQAPAEQLPLADGCADLVFMSMMLHHIGDKERAARECRRVLDARGRLAIRNSTRDSDHVQRRFFPGIEPLIQADMPSRQEIVQTFEGAGLKLAEHQIVPHPVAGSWGELADKLALRADSFLARLPAAEFAASMAALRAHAAGRPADEPILEKIDFLVFAPLTQG